MEKNFLKAKSSYAFAMIDGKLTECRILSVTNDYTGEERSVRFNVWHNGNTSWVKHEDLYLNEEHFRNGWVLELEKADNVGNDTALYEDGKLVFYTMFEGKPVRHEEEPTTITYYYNIETDYVFEGTIPLTGEAYATRQACLDHNTYKVVDDKGNEREVVGIAKLVELDEDQLQLIMHLHNLLEEIDKQGIHLSLDTDGEDLYAFNARNVKSCTWDSVDNEDCVEKHMHLVYSGIEAGCMCDYAPTIIRK